MIVTQKDIDALLAAVKGLVVEIQDARAQFAKAQEEIESANAEALDQAKRDYDARLDKLNREADRLTLKIAHVRRALASQTTHTYRPDVDLDVLRVVPPPPVVDRGETAAVPPAPPPADPRRERKRAVADFLYYFMDQAQSEQMAVINAVLNNPDRGVGELLELLAWGDGSIWSARYPWESMEDQYARLMAWRGALERRRDAWLDRVERITSEQRYALWTIKTHDPAGWPAYLDGLAEDQARDNADRARLLAALEARYRQHAETREAEQERQDG